MSLEELQAIRDEWINTTTYTDEGESYKRVVADLCDEIERLHEALLMADTILRTLRHHFNHFNEANQNIRNLIDGNLSKEDAANAI